MLDRTALLEAALDSRQEGIGLLNPNGEVVYWNQAAESITGYAARELVARTFPEALVALMPERNRTEEAHGGDARPEGNRALVRVTHKLGHAIPVLMRLVLLRDRLGERVGSAAVFHPVESLDALPHGEAAGDGTVEESCAELEERLQFEFEDFARSGPPFGVAWIAVDQAGELCKTHGANACHEMLGKVRRALAQGLRPGEVMGRWGDDEFLIIAHERTAGMLAAHAQMLVGLARTADFRWWGDRVSLTVSMGAAQASSGAQESLAQLLARARGAMAMSSEAGGNRATLATALSAIESAAEETTCSQS